MTITLKNVPAHLHRSLKKQAKLHKRSLNQEAMSCLEATLGQEKRRREAFEEINRFREKLARRGVRGLGRVKVRKSISEGRA